MWVGVQVPNLVSKYVTGLVGGVDELPCARLKKYCNRFRQMSEHLEVTEMFPLLSRGVYPPR